ncbi:MAG: polynucleotide kinase-phosphatase [Myxococcota bacterium]
MTTVTVPKLSLVVLIGPSGAGKSTFAKAHFCKTEVLSSDFFRGLVSDDESDQSATADAFRALHHVAETRLARGKLTVIDATNVQRSARKPLIELARAQHVLPVAIAFDLPRKLCQQRNASRADRAFGPHVIRQQAAQLRKSLRGLKREGFRRVIVLSSPEEVEAVTIERQPLWNDKRSDHGPFDIIGDVHGCRAELEALLARLGYVRRDGAFQHPEGRRALFLGDLVDRGPDSPGVLELVMAMAEAGAALCVPGNHDVKLVRKLRGKKVRIAHGLAETLAQLEARSNAFKDKVCTFLDGLVSHYVLDDGKLVVAHAGLIESLQGRASGRVREFALYGETTGETDEFGLPVRYDWAQAYRGRAAVVYGHTPVPRAEWINNTICIDTGCVFGGSLTALRYPERELVSVPASGEHYPPVNPLASVDPRPAHVLSIADVMGKRIVDTRLDRSVTVREEYAAAALETMSRFAVDPRWLITLPPTMSPAQRSSEPGFLEHPREAFAYFRQQGVTQVICEEKHMGSRAIVVACRSEIAAKARFGVEGLGRIYTRTGRPFFSDAALERTLVARVTRAFEEADLWRTLDSDWACLDTELLPWSAKARELLQTQYLPTGAAAQRGLSAAIESLLETAQHNPDAAALQERYTARLDHVRRYVDAVQAYCWPVRSVDDLAVAPFHLLASEGRVHTDRDHRWHMETLNALAKVDPTTFHPTAFRLVDLGAPESEAAATEWWLETTAKGGEGMVIKPLAWIHRSERALVQPAIKCRGPEYLRIIYGPEYPTHLDRLGQRNLSTKRKLARKEFALGLEALHRFVEGEPLYRVHECVFGVLALESEPVDPRL